ncbi:MAG: hypothetical protein ACKV2T_25825 [Kofleriaceae bacterium]
MKLLFALLTLTAACYGAHRDRGDDTPMPDGGIDAPMCGTTTCDDVTAPACEGNTLVTYGATCEGNACSYPETEVDCGSSGCCGDHCCGFAPSNGSDFGAVTSNGMSVAPPNGTFDTSTECTNPSALGACEVATRADLGEVCVCRADRFTIGDLRINGSRALVLFAHREVIVTGKLEVSGRNTVAGPGASYLYSSTPSYKNHGGVGGSYASVGGSNAVGRTALPVYGDPSLVPLTGGMSGEASGGSAGGGGGALQISARESIQVTGTINAGGGGGGGGVSAESLAGGGGGGSGGAILLEALTVVVNGKLYANGGGGGGAGGETRAGSTGGNGGYNDLSPAYGGDGDDGGGCALQGTTSGGWGGVGGRGPDSPTIGGPSDSVSGCFNYAFVGGGGGGGAVGRIRINTMTGCQCGGTISPNPTYGTVVQQ